MRQWLVNPKCLCKKHLLGEHVECHMMLGSLKKKKSLTRFLNEGLYDVSKLELRHSELVNEMQFRGYNHKSALDFKPEYLSYLSNTGSVNIEKNINELKRRCPECNTRIEVVYGKI